MTHPGYLRDRAREMRVERNMTIDDLAERLALSRSTIYHWVRDLPIERSADRQSAGQRRRSARNVERCRLKRAAAYEQGRAEFSELAQDPTFRDFVCMYIGEGYKRNRNRVSVANSDPVVVSLCTAWMRRLAERELSFSVHHHADQDPAWLQAFWGFRLGFEPTEMSTFRKSNSGELRGRQWRCKYGVVQVTAHETELRSRLQAWIDATMSDWTTLPLDRAPAA